MSITIKSFKFKPYINIRELNLILENLSQKINRDFQKTNGLNLIIILNGAFMFGSDLAKKLNNVKSINFMKVSSYNGFKSTGKLTIDLDLQINIRNEDVLIIEDIIDTGLTMNNLCKRLHGMNPKSLNICSLLLKKDTFNKNLHKLDYLSKNKINYLGKEIKDQFVIGYGLDYNGLGRNLPCIYIKN